MNNIITDLLNYAFDNNINLIITRQLSTSTPSLVHTESRQIIFNAKWHNQKQLAFSLAHEISHIINGDESYTPLYFTPSKAKFELEANARAIKMLLPYYVADKEVEQFNSHDFMECFGIPSHLEDIVIKEIKNY